MVVIVSFNSRSDGLSVAAMVALMAVLLTVRLAQAHGGGGTVQLSGQNVADHDVIVMTAPKRPRVGALHVAVQLIDPSELTYIETATVTATARYLGDETMRVRSTRSRYREPWHELDLDLKLSGPWQVKLYIDGPNGQGESSLRVNISPDPD
jgi:hypothetical protein